MHRNNAAQYLTRAIPALSKAVFDLPTRHHDDERIAYCLNHDFLAPCAQFLMDSNVSAPGIMTHLMHHQSRFADRMQTYAFQNVQSRLPNYPFNSAFLTWITSVMPSIEVEPAPIASNPAHLVVPWEQLDSIKLLPAYFGECQFQDVQHSVFSTHPHVSIVHSMMRYYATLERDCLYPLIFQVAPELSTIEEVDVMAQKLLSGASFDPVVIEFYPYLHATPITHFEHLSAFLAALHHIDPQPHLDTTLLVQLSRGEVDPTPYVQARFLYADIELYPAYATYLPDTFLPQDVSYYA